MLMRQGHRHNRDQKQYANHYLAVKDNDLIAATHGRSFWVLDDVTPLHQAALLGSGDEAVLFHPEDAYAVRGGGRFRGGRRGGRAADGEREPIGPNPLTGVVVNYYLPAGS